MIGVNICIIDDGFMLPAQAANLGSHSYFSGAAIKVLTSQVWEKDQPLKELCDTIIDQQKEDGSPAWSVSGFRLPGFFRDAFEAGKYRSDLIVFDWEYAGANVDQIDELKFILSKSHAHVIIFTGADKDAEIRAVLDDDLSQYRGRVELLDKSQGGVSQHARLMEILQQKQSNNFSFKFGTELRSAVSLSLDNVLCRLAELDIDRVLKILSEQDNDPIDADLKEMIGEKLKEGIKGNAKLREQLVSAKLDEAKAAELLEIISEAVKTDVASLEMTHTSDDVAPAEGDDPEQSRVMEQLWSYRLYHKPTDDVVRSGDVISPTGGDGSELYLVVTPPCDLAKFWKSTDGRMVVFRLEEIVPGNENLKTRANQLKPINNIRKAFRTGRISSLTNGQSLNSNLPGKPYLLPLVPVNGALRSYLLNSHGISNFKIEVPEAMTADGQRNVLSSAALHYDNLDFDLVTKISDPFCGAILGAALSDLSGWGVADFPTALQTAFSKNLDASLGGDENGEA